MTDFGRLFEFIVYFIGGQSVSHPSSKTRNKEYWLFYYIDY